MSDALSNTPVDFDMLVFSAVVLARFLIPLAIPRFPLPGILAALLIDAIDQTIFQTFTTLNLGGYQGYDKALDIYYLTLAYVATLRNWTNLFVFKISRYLWYYRLIGVTLFELTAWRPLLFIFPNTFEYFFIFYELVRLRWSPQRLTERATLLTAAAIWIFIKLPHEYWIHIAQLDATDFLKTELLGAPLDTPWSAVLATNLWLIPLLTLLVAAVALSVRLLLRHLPPADWPLSFHASAHRHGDPALAPANQPAGRSPRFFNAMLLEKILLVALVCIIFGQIMPTMGITTLELAIGIAYIIVLNSVVSHWLARRGTTWRSELVEFAAMAVLNFSLAVLYLSLLPRPTSAVNTDNLLFLVLLLTLIVILFDHYYPRYRRRRAAQVAATPPQ